MKKNIGFSLWDCKNLKTKALFTAFVGAMLLASCSISDQPVKPTPVEPGKKYSTMLEARPEHINPLTTKMIINPNGIHNDRIFDTRLYSPEVTNEILTFLRQYIY